VNEDADDGMVNYCCCLINWVQFAYYFDQTVMRKSLLDVSFDC
jgi:hypothetical protein